MILRRFMQHVREQNWFAVGLDVIVVIVGIFLGLQVQAAYEERAEQKLEREYLQQLYDEVDLAHRRAAGALNRSSRIADILKNIQDSYQSSKNIPDLSEEKCNAIATSNIYTNYIPPISTLDEMESVGRTGIISSATLRNTISTYKSRRDGTDRITTQMSNNTASLLENFPNLIEIVRFDGTRSIEAKVGNQCHADLMNENPHFKNHLLNNIFKYIVFNIALTNQYGALEQLQSAIADELGISHEEDGA